MVILLFWKEHDKNISSYNHDQEHVGGFHCEDPDNWENYSATTFKTG